MSATSALFGGIPIPELALLSILDHRKGSGGLIDQLTTNADVLDMVLQVLSAEQQDSLRTALLKRPGKARLAYPGDDVEDWSLIVLKVNEGSIGLRTLGDRVGTPAESALGAADLNTAIGTGPETALDLVGGVPAGIPGHGRVRLEAELASYRVDAGPVVVLDARGIAGTKAAAHAIGIPVVFHEMSQRVGWGELCQLQVAVLSSNPLLNLLLSTLVKATLIARAIDFEDLGMTLKGISESDLQPRPTAWPAHLFSRTVTVEIQRDFAIPTTFPLVGGLATVDLSVEGV